jgi:hypothetical protein
VCCASTARMAKLGYATLVQLVNSVTSKVPLRAQAKGVRLDSLGRAVRRSLMLPNALLAH